MHRIIGVNEIWCETISYCSLRTHEAFFTLVWNGLSFDASVSTMLLFALWKTNLFFISSLISIYPFPFIVLIKIWHMIESVLLGKAWVLVGLLAGFPSVVAFKSLAQKMHSAFVYPPPPPCPFWCISFMHRPICSRRHLQLALQL